WRAYRQQQLAVGIELVNCAAFVSLARILREFVRARGARVGYPDVAVAIDVNAVRPDEHAGAEALDLLAVLVEVVNRIHHRAETAGRRPGGAAVGRPDGLAVLVDRDAVRSAPRAIDLRPVAHHAIRVRP